MRDTGFGLVGMSGGLLVVCAFAALWPGNRPQLRFLATLAFVVFLVGLVMFVLGSATQ